MFKGYAGYGSVELLNVARLMKYTAEGGVPVDSTVEPMVGDYTDLPAALGHEAYRTALLDYAPWYDPSNPDSAFFSGLLPLEITGLDGSTRGRSVTEGLSDGGTAGRARASSRVIGVTALALASGDAALDAGLAWLAGVLHPPCADAPEACNGSPLTLFSAAPVYCNHTPDPDTGVITTELIPYPQTVSQFGPGLAFNDVYDTWLPSVCGMVSVTAVVHLNPPEGEHIVGKVVVMELADRGGTVYASAQADLPSDGSAVSITVTTEPSPGFDAEWQPVLRWYDAAVIWGGTAEEGDYDVIGGLGAGEETDPLYTGVDADGPWLLGLGDGNLLTVETWTYLHDAEYTTDACLTELRRSYRNVVTVDGPTVVEELTLDDGTPYAAKVEWTWVATDPVAYGDTIPLLAGMMVGAPGSVVDTTARAASTGNIDLTAPSFSVTPTILIDGVLINTPGQRVLFKDQDNPAENGVRVFQGYGVPWLRSAVMDTWDEVDSALVQVQFGNTQAGLWESTATAVGTLDSTPIEFVPYVAPPSGYDEDVLYRAAGIQITDNTEVTGVSVACPLPEPVVVLCGDDPDLPAVLLPPQPPILADPGMPTVATYVRRAFQVPPDLSPQPSGSLTIDLRNVGDEAYRGIRVRLWADTDPDFGVADECAFEQEFYVSYLAPEQTVTIDGPNHRVTTTCESGIDADHERNMRGAYGGPFAFPVLQCGERYHIAIDVPVTVDAGGIAVDFSVTRRGV